MPPKKIKIQSKIDKPQDNKNIIKVEKLSSKEEKSSSEEDKKDNDSEKDNTTIETSMSIIKPSKSIKDPIIEKKETEVKKKEPEVKKTQSIASTPATATKPKIEEVKQTNNTVDMFDEDDLDVRNVMMNYDYTKNKTNPRITKYEMALLIGKRATQIECGATPNIKISPGQSVISIAEEELRQRKIPLIIKRPIGNTFEYWKPAHMEVSMN